MAECPETEEFDVPHVAFRSLLASHFLSALLSIHPSIMRCWASTQAYGLVTIPNLEIISARCTNSTKPTTALRMPSWHIHESSHLDRGICRNCDVSCKTMM